MPIRVVHGVPITALGQAQALGAQAAQEQRLQEVAFNQDQQQQRTNLAMLNTQYGFARDRAALQQRRDQLNAALQNRLLQQQMDQDFSLERLQMGEGLMQDRMGLAADIQAERDQTMWDRESVDATENAALDVLSQYRRMPLTAEGQQKLHQFDSRVRALQSQRTGLRDAAYAQKLSEVIDDFGKQRMEDFVEPPEASIEDLIQKGQLYRDPESGDWWGFDYRNGVKVPRQFKASKPEAVKEEDPMKAPITTKLGTMTQKEYRNELQSLYNEERKRLMDEWAAKNLNYDATSGQPKPPEPGEEDVLAAVEKREDAISAYMRKRGVLGEQAGGGELEVLANGKPAPPVPSDVPTFSSPDELAGYVGYFIGKSGQLFYIDEDGELHKQ